LSNAASHNGLPEIWKVIPDTEGLYEASTLGRIRTHHNGRHRKAKDGILTPLKIDKGARTDGSLITRLKVTIYVPGRPKRLVSVARLVLLAHKGPPGPGGEARHWNDQPEDNRLENLYWGTRTENQIDAKINRNRGSKHFASSDGMSMIHRCRHSGEMVLNLLLQSVDGCNCPRHREDPDGCSECMFVACDVPDEPSADAA